MGLDAVTEDIPAFETDVIGITCTNGVPTGIVFFHDGKLLGAELGEGLTDGVPRYTDRRNRPVTAIDAPAGMTAKVKGTRLTRNYVRDFQMYRDTTVTYEAVLIRMER